MPRNDHSFSAAVQLVMMIINIIIIIIMHHLIDRAVVE